ncbi:uncharacterized protein L3040_003319 [Drepanopeziza brunnea f. sp. 'multigermtubi']|uniref:Uncharacterized protein n=1 Tax=Marssonina brunnea f. sp. multigermtubi (strain MB_m1) TaxID=1072389 RepID=K1WS04_MARBU|nr:uncharacterized protein MBM_05837 [Drepanopeziza brunnea f. sp. 'multigermtubi' MB_m1]EKD15826.1 hypothetical protein MBM_05837 [Drepanopeziza brunnea f. sp. 'multigermtubi' MB_m1]KAJ5047495.1 hypothetical protein L3040_003319 [Drepanopeziza brunnea f. sp. 'multigermtubi']
MFFTSWQLWEQMTFVLALAIVGVFLVGWGKLLWVNRLVQRQEVVDEEKRTKIEQLRNSGQIVESRRSHDIPFGIRAIQSGIQVDGIWISQANTPMPSVLNLGHLRGSSSDNLASTDASKGVEASDSRYEDTKPTSRYGRSSFRSIDLGALSDAQDPMVQGTRTSYQPRKSSYLRQGSHGVFDKGTLGQLEGKTSLRRGVQAHRPRGSRIGNMNIDSSSAADNEHSSDSEASLSQEPKMTDLSRKALLNDKSASEGRLLSLSSVPSGRPVTAHGHPQSAKAAYFSVPVESPDFDKSDPFETPHVSPLDSVRPQQTFTGPNRLDASQQAGSRTRSPSPFVPGELHVNKVARKVNSGFEVLPAGTFGRPKDADEDVKDDPRARRRSAKLQKKPRGSMTGGRPSNAMERP